MAQIVWFEDYRNHHQAALINKLTHATMYTMYIDRQNKKLSYRRETARCRVR